MEEQNEILNKTVARELVITHELDAPRELVFKAWTEAERLAQWWGPQGYKVRIAGLDLCPCGTFHYCLQSAEGYEMWGKFVYREITAPGQIVYVSSFSDAEANVTRAPFSQAWPLEIRNTLTLTEHAGKTTLTLRSSPLNATPEEQETFEEGHTALKKGFSGTLGQLDSYLAKTKAEE